MADSTNETTMVFINDSGWVKGTRVSFGTYSAGVIENMAGGVNELPAWNKETNLVTILSWYWGDVNWGSHLNLHAL
jgi:hypothetical protein